MDSEKVQLAVLKTQMEQNHIDHKEIKAVLVEITTKLDSVIETKVDKVDFYWWRNILISGIIISIFVMLVSILLK